MRRDIQFYSETSLIQGHLYLPDGHSPDGHPSDGPSSDGHSPDGPSPVGPTPGSQWPCVILCHGFAGFKELLLPAFARAFAENGFAALVFDYRGFGASGGDKGQLVWREQVRDIRNAVTFAETLPEVDPEKIGLWGTSYGGANVIETAAQDKRVKCLVAQISFGDGERVITGGQTPQQKEKLSSMLTKAWQRETQKGKPMMLPIDNLLTDPQSKAFFARSVKEFPQLESKISISFLRHTLEYHPEQRLKEVAIPILIVGAEKDEVNPVQESHSLFGNALEPKSLHIVKGAGHYDVYEGAFFEDAFKAERDWFRKYLV